MSVTVKRTWAYPELRTIAIPARYPALRGGNTVGQAAADQLGGGPRRAISRHVFLVGCPSDRAAARPRDHPPARGQLRPDRRAVLRHAADLQYRRNKADR